MLNIPQIKLDYAVEALQDAGLVISTQQLINAVPKKLYRTGTLEKPKSINAWFKVLYDGSMDFITIIYGNWETGLSKKCYINLKDNTNYSSRSKEEQQAYQIAFNAKIEAEKLLHSVELAKKRDYWSGIYQSLPKCDNHNYLERKGVNYLPAYDLKIDTRHNRNLLCVPFMNQAGNLQGYQTIAHDGTKRFNGSVGGCFWQYPLNNPNTKLFTLANSFFILCEGLATGLSAYQAINEYYDSGIFLPIILCAFNVGNISKVVSATKQHRLPYLYLIDNDASKICNAGIETAKSILNTHHDCEIYPLTFTNGNDANDYIMNNGIFAFIQLLNQYANPVINKILR